MKRATKIWLIAGALLIVVGGVIFYDGMSKLHWDFSAFDNLHGKVRENCAVDITEDFQNVEIHCIEEDVSFLPSTDGTCRVSFYEEEEKLRHVAEVEDGTLFITLTDTRKWYERISFFSSHMPRVTVSLPEKAYGTLSVGAGNTTLPGELSFEQIDISSAAGDVDCRASASGLIRIDTGAGDISCKNITAAALELTVSTGRVDARSVDCEGDVQVSVDTGDAFLKDVSCQSVLSSGSTGEMLLEHVVAAEAITVERSTGNVNFERSDAAELLIKTNTGDVTGSLLSPKVFITQSDTGHIDVPKTTTGGKCEIVTGTGNIALSIP